MEVFSTLWRPRSSITIPRYGTGEDADPVDLQVKALFYMFRRVNMAHGQFTGDPQGLDTDVQGISSADQERLDVMYNKNGFKDALLGDPHRILVDWVKNRFRSMLILPHWPQMDKLPDFPDKGFRFVVLEPDASNDEYVRTLTSSNIYAEHAVPTEVLARVVTTLLTAYPQKTLSARNAIIIGYLHRVAVEVQVSRLYKASLANRSPKLTPSSPKTVPKSPKLKTGSNNPDRTALERSPSPIRIKLSTSPERAAPIRPTSERTPSPIRPSSPERRGNPHPLSDRSGSPVRIKLSASPPRPAQRPPSPTRDPGREPPKLRVKQSLSNMRLPAPEVNGGKRDNVKALSADARSQLLNQARLAVRARIEREQQAIDILKHDYNS